jgi:hypothetical protein
MVRQGDVLIERVNTRPAKSKRQKGRPILAHGEATGHAHEIEVLPGRGTIATIEDVEREWPVAGDLRDSAPMTLKMLEMSKESAVVHQEHARIPLEKGTYRVTRQREYSPEAIRNVAD